MINQTLETFLHLTLMKCKHWLKLSELRANNHTLKFKTHETAADTLHNFTHRYY